MELNNLLFFFIVIYMCDAVAGLRECSICVPIRLCPEASRLLDSPEGRRNSATIEKFKKALCGVDRSKGTPSPKICCSDFEGIVDKPEQDSDVETHSNIGLLPETCGSIDDDRLLWTTYARLYEFPWMALVSYETRDDKDRRKYEFKCAGTVINSRYVLTAAHCVQGHNIAGVRVGDLNIKTRVDCQGEDPYKICESHVQDIQVQKSIVHEDYSRNPHVQNDIALLRLKKTIDFSYRNAKPICLPKYEGLRNITLSGKMATLTGWGITDFGRLFFDLLKDNIPIKSDAECRETYNITTGDKFCGGKERHLLCTAVGGSPLMLEEEYDGDYRYIQYGITSFGAHKCGSALPDVYTDTRKFMKWILDNIEE